MPLLLAPYNDSMRLGHGFNSYTHELCIDKAVEVKTPSKRQSDAQAQTVSYSSRQISKLSDVVDSMNVSFSDSIRKGTVDINGSTNTLDETIFKESDINIMVSVKVTNQTTVIDDDATFSVIDNLSPGTTPFNDVYGDCYISGFIEGGDLTGIISIKVLNASKASAKVAQIKNTLNTDAKGGDLILDPFDAIDSSSRKKALEDTECTVSVSWRGGGQIKDDDHLWDINSLYTAAASFATKVADVPQKTWAILTKYKANRSFVKHFTTLSLHTMLQYDQISTFTAELFDSFMDYKVLLKIVQQIIIDRKSYQPKTGENAIDLSTSTLLSVKLAMRNEQAKIVKAIQVLSQNPNALEANSTDVAVQANSVVRKIIATALGSNSTSTLGSPSSAIQKTSEKGISGLSTEKDLKTPSAGSTGVPTPSTSISSTGDGNAVPGASFDFKTLIPPEIWGDLLPELTPPSLQTNFGLQIGLGSNNGPVHAPPAPPITISRSAPAAATMTSTTDPLQNATGAGGLESFSLTTLQAKVTLLEGENTKLTTDNERLAQEKKNAEDNLTQKVKEYDNQLSIERRRTTTVEGERDREKADRDSADKEIKAMVASHAKEITEVQQKIGNAKDADLQAAEKKWEAEKNEAVRKAQEEVKQSAQVEKDQLLNQIKNLEYAKLEWGDRPKAFKSETLEIWYIVWNGEVLSNEKLASNIISYVENNGRPRTWFEVLNEAGMVAGIPGMLSGMDISELVDQVGEEKTTSDTFTGCIVYRRVGTGNLRLKSWTSTFIHTIDFSTMR